MNDWRLHLETANSEKFFVLIFYFHFCKPAVTGRSNNNIFGRSSRSHNPTVSRLHAVMTKNNGKWYITDKNSTNGTSVNGVRIAGTKTLKNNDVIEISDEVFDFTDDYR